MAWEQDENNDWVWTGDIDTGDTQTVDVDPYNYFETQPTAADLAELNAADAFATGDLSGVADTSTGSVTNADGSKTYTYAGGSTVTTDATGKKILGMTGDTTSKSWESILKSLPTKAADALKRLVVKPDGSLDIGNIGNVLGALGSLGLSNKPNQAGYNVPIPELSMTRQQVMPNDPNRRPGSGGLNYFTDPKYAKLGDAPAQSAAQAADTAQAAGIRAAYTPATAAVNPWAGKMPMSALTTTATNPMASTQTAAQAVLPVPQATLPVSQAVLPVSQAVLPVSQATVPDRARPKRNVKPMAAGGLASFAKGGDNYLRGDTDGMADKLNTTIDDKQAAKLSHGEFVIPADVVSHLGNGNSDAGAQKLYDMMARIRKARTGNPEQGKRINPEKFMPGGLAQYNSGGVVAFPTGGEVVAPASTSTTDVLSEYAGPLVSGMLSKGYAASNAPYQAYTGPLTAGASDLQNQAFAGASDLAKTGYTPTSFTTGTFDTTAANKYMNPYISASLDPQLKELQRQAKISSMADTDKLSQAGAYGGSRQAILQGEQNRNLLDKSQSLISSGYKDAYDKAMSQFNTEQTRGMEAQKAGEESRQYGAEYGTKSIQNLADLGATQRGITGEGITADKTQFEEQRDNPLKMAQYQASLLSKLPITTQNKNVNTSDYNNFLSKLDDINVQLKRLGVIP
jgi:hypothetical protein